MNLFFPNSATRLILLLVAVIAVHATSGRADQTEDAVTAIRAKYNQIERSQLDAQTVAFESNTEPASGTLTKYYRNGQIQKANFSYVAGDHGGADETYYYSEGQLIFIFISQSYWQFTGRTKANGEGETKDVVVEHRLYFAPGTLIRHLRKEAESTNSAALPGLLAKTENVPHQDLAMVNEVVARSLKAPGITTAGALEQMFLGP